MYAKKEDPSAATAAAIEAAAQPVTVDRRDLEALMGYALARVAPTIDVLAIGDTYHRLTAALEAKSAEVPESTMTAFRDGPFTMLRFNVALPDGLLAKVHISPEVGDEAWSKLRDVGSAAAQVAVLEALQAMAE